MRRQKKQRNKQRSHTDESSPFDHLRPCDCRRCRLAFWTGFLPRHHPIGCGRRPQLLSAAPQTAAADGLSSVGVVASGLSSAGGVPEPWSTRLARPAKCWSSTASAANVSSSGTGRLSPVGCFCSPALGGGMSPRSTSDRWSGGRTTCWTACCSRASSTRRLASASAALRCLLLPDRRGPAGAMGMGVSAWVGVACKGYSCCTVWSRSWPIPALGCSLLNSWGSLGCTRCWLSPTWLT
mmetsp:Transcript_46724/g.100181  ORF Transcript_46724/g.100181 Transcript_46724/m.100181 type:complete len:238 (+) Transcript_46724:402-1115(+)